MVLVDVWEEHLDEEAFRWTQWERALVAPDFTLEETAKREERLLAHLDALEEEAALDTVVRPPPHVRRRRRPGRRGAGAGPIMLGVALHRARWRQSGARKTLIYGSADNGRVGAASWR
ncbi:hypothetical protein [Myxococcus sp. CA040A]|uniref:hypothetical protein n=1 Tax=Myxococcus sp. CA040A TaxID=2741738 RepID=UPI0020C5CCC5|nr:hypothetical protein [Myxococcus sp. CA040A]